MTPDGPERGPGRARTGRKTPVVLARAAGADRDRAGDRAGHQDLRGPGVLHPVVLDGEHARHRRQGAGQQARLSTSARIQPGDIVVFNGAGSWDPVPPVRPRPAPTRSSGCTTRRWARCSTRSPGCSAPRPGSRTTSSGSSGCPATTWPAAPHGQVTVNGVALHETVLPVPRQPRRPRSSSASPCRRAGCGSWATTAASPTTRAATCGDPGDGTIPENQVVGRAFMIVWPPSRWRVLPIPATFGQPGIDQQRRGRAEPGRRGRLRLPVPAAPYCRWEPALPRRSR